MIFLEEHAVVRTPPGVDPGILTSTLPREETLPVLMFFLGYLDSLGFSIGLKIEWGQVLFSGD